MFKGEQLDDIAIAISKRRYSRLCAPASQFREQEGLESEGSEVNQHEALSATVWMK